jgi:DNA-binding CsgD family transcriptional regulator
MNLASNKIERQLSQFLEMAFSKENSNPKAEIKLIYTKVFDNKEAKKSIDYRILGEFIANIHSEYTKYYIDWMLAFIKLSNSIGDNLMTSSLRLFFPFKDENGYFSWCMLTVFPSQNKDIICLNQQITYLSKRFQIIFLPGEIWCRGNIDWDQTKQLHQKYKNQNKFKFTKNQQRIIELYTLNPEYTQNEIAEILNKSKNTIAVQCKQIVKKSTEYYGIKFKNTKSLVNHLKESNQLL